MAKRTQVQQTGLFTAADHKSLLDARRRLNALIETCDKAEACGINVDTLRQMRASIDAQLGAIQQHFMTPPPA